MEVTCAADIWSFGLLLYEIFGVDDNPFTESYSSYDEFVQLAKQDKLIPKALPAGSPAAVVNMYQLCLKASRPSAADLLDLVMNSCIVEVTPFIV